MHACLCLYLHSYECTRVDVYSCVCTCVCVCVGMCIYCFGLYAFQTGCHKRGRFVFYKYDGSHEWLALFYSQVGGFPGGSVVQNPPANAGDTSSIPRWGRSPGEGNDSLLQYSCLGNPMDREACRATVHGITRVGHDLATKTTIWFKFSKGLFFLFFFERFL